MWDQILGILDSFRDAPLDSLINTFQDFHLPGVFITLLLCGFGLPIPEDIILIASGYVTYLNDEPVFRTILVCLAGVMVGDVIIFSFGKIYGKKILEVSWVKKIITVQKMDKIQGFLNRHGNKTIFFGRFAAGMRAPLYLSSGIMNISYLRFILNDLAAAIISVPLIVYLAHYFGEDIDHFVHILHKSQKYVVIGIVLIVLILLFRFFKKKYARGRKKS